MIAQDAFRTRLALLQRSVPFDVARLRQLLAGAIRKSATYRDAKSSPNRAAPDGPAHFSRGVSPHEFKTFAELYPTLQEGELLSDTRDKRFAAAWAMAKAGEFRVAA